MVAVHTLSAAHLVSLWEEGLAEHHSRRAVSMLAAASPGVGCDELSRLPVGTRDGRLLALHERLFGDRFDGVASCAGCGERLDVSFASADVRSPADAGVGAGHGGAPAFRLPDSEDMAAIAGAPDVGSARRELLARCVVDRRVGELSEQEVAEVASAMADADPQADVRLIIDCPACGERATVLFDVAAFLWAKVERAAGALLVDVHHLAAAYGWQQDDILAMTAQRRRVYLDLLGR